ncbi:unnamed protein product [Acidithrix sp. C25]|nr:unnamed protein product [Acidithrix sp. C25]
MALRGCLGGAGAIWLPLDRKYPAYQTLENERIKRHTKDKLGRTPNR